MGIAVSSVYFSLLLLHLQYLVVSFLSPSKTPKWKHNTIANISLAKYNIFSENSKPSQEREDFDQSMCAAVEKSHEILTPSLSITNLAMSEPIDDDQILVVYRILGKKVWCKPHREGKREDRKSLPLLSFIRLTRVKRRSPTIHRCKSWKSFQNC